VSGAAQVRAAAQVRKQQLSEIEASQRRELQRVEAVFGCLYRRFTFESQFWLLVLMARKAAFVFAAVMLTTKPQSQSAILLLVLVASIALQLVWRPYSRIDDPRVAHQQQQQQQQRDSPSSSSSSSGSPSSWWVWSRAREAARRLRTDPNVMEASSLVSSSLVLLSGVLYSASRTEGLAGSGWRGRSLDVSCAAIIAGSAGYMVVAVSVPVAMGLRDVMAASSRRHARGPRSAAAAGMLRGASNDGQSHVESSVTAHTLNLVHVNLGRASLRRTRTRRRRAWSIRGGPCASGAAAARACIRTRACRDPR
jgi:hypothetical protein